ncbi:MAG: glutathione S-transferase family protein [Persicimonas sp.]
MYRLYVNSMSPYALKSSAMIGYAGLPCEPVIQNVVNRFATLKRLTGKTMIPVLRRGEWAINDSSRIAEYLVGHGERPLLARDEALAPICWLLEDFADEWLSMWVLLSRWSHEADVEQNTEEIGRELTGGLPVLSGVIGQLAVVGIRKNVRRGGARPANEQALNRSRERFLQALETVLDAGPDFLFERYPTVADFAIFGQLHQYGRDPTGGDELRLYPSVREYLQRLDAMALPHPAVHLHAADSRPVSDLAPLLAEFLGTYGRVLVANHRAYHGSERPDGLEVAMLDGEVFSLRPNGYLAARLEFVLGQLDRAYTEREELFGGKGLELEHALVQLVGRLTDYPAGRELMRKFPSIAKD